MLYQFKVIEVTDGFVRMGEWKMNVFVSLCSSCQLMLRVNSLDVTRQTFKSYAFSGFATAERVEIAVK